MKAIVAALCATASSLALSILTPANAAEPAGKNVSLWVGQAQKIGSAADDAPVRLAILLNFKNRDAIEALVKAQYTPGSSEYGKYLSPVEFRGRFAPDASTVNMVRDTLRDMGFKIESTPASGLFVEVSGTVAQVRSAFGVSQDLYAYKGMTLRANAETPTLPAKLAGIVSYVAGLDDTGLLKRPLHISADGEAERLKPAMAADLDGERGENAPPPVQAGIESPVCSTYWGDHTATLSTAPAPYPAVLPWLICGYTPQQLRQAYHSDQVAQTGVGVRVGIVDAYASPTIVADTNRYSKNHGLPPLNYLNFQQIIPPGIYNVPAGGPCNPQGWYGEESLDVQSVHSMAPDAFIIYTGELNCQVVNTALYNLIDNRLVDIVTNSYGYGGEALPPDFIFAENQVFLQAAAEGMSVLFSSGDGGDLANNANAANGIASGSWEATSPYVTGVGGTSLALFANGSKNEWGWGDYRALLVNPTVSPSFTTIQDGGAALPWVFYAGSGGGPSLSQLQPDYQASVVPAAYAFFTTLANGAKVPFETPHRVTPDIAMDADPYTGFLYGETYTIAGNPINDAPCKPLSKTTEYCETAIGGTSLASPLFAGVLALVNQARFASGKSAVGFVNPALYALTVGAPGTIAAPIIDVNRPLTPTALLRGYLGNPNKVRVVTMNSVPNKANTTVLEGYDTSYRTGLGYDEVTGLGTPNVPALIQALTK